MSEIEQPWYVIGHQNPDADAIFSAIGHAAYLQAMGHAEVLPARCGEVTERTRLVLEKAGVPVPELLRDVRPTAGSICRRKVVSVREEHTFLDAYQLMLKEGVRSVPVLDEDGTVLGLLRFLDLLQLLLPPDTHGMEGRTIHASLANVSRALGADSTRSVDPATKEEDHILMVGASSQDTVEMRLKHAREEGLVSSFVVICGDRPVVHQHAINFGVRALIITGGYQPSEALAQMAREKGITVLCGPDDTATTVKRTMCARRVSNVSLDESFRAVEYSQPLSRISRELAGLQQDLIPVVADGSRKLVGVFSKSDLLDPPRMRLSLVDHNEFSQAVKGVEEAEVVEIIDHHRLSGDLVSREPVRFLNEPLGSTSTIVSRRFWERRARPEKGVAMCLAAGLISDTLNLTSPTTTDVDREALSWLCEIAGVLADEFAADFFASGSLLVNESAKVIVSTDRKEFSEEGVTVSLSQIEELSLDGFGGRREELETELERLRVEKGHALAALLLTDIRTHRSLLLAVGQGTVLDAIDYRREDATLFDAAGVVSRKKQLFPAISRALAKSAAMGPSGE
jgi:manganese-dependent inorganic pyrophosphatase